MTHSIAFDPSSGVTEARVAGVGDKGLHLKSLTIQYYIQYCTILNLPPAILFGSVWMHHNL